MAGSHLHEQQSHRSADHIRLSPWPAQPGKAGSANTQDGRTSGPQAYPYTCNITDKASCLLLVSSDLWLALEAQNMRQDG